MNGILIVEDESFEAEEMKQILAASFPGCPIHVAASCNKAISAIQREPLDLVTLDIMLGGSSGFEVARYLHENCPDIRVVIITAFEEFDFAKKAIDLGISDYLLKPVRPKEMIDCINKALGGRKAGFIRQTVWPYIRTGLFDDLSRMLPACPNTIAVTSFAPETAGRPQDINNRLWDQFAAIVEPHGWLEKYGSLMLVYLELPPGPQMLGRLNRLKLAADRLGADWVRFGVADTHADIGRLPMALDEAICAFLQISFSHADALIGRCDREAEHPPCEYPLEIQNQFMKCLERKDYPGCEMAAFALVSAFVNGCHTNYNTYEQWVQRFCHAADTYISAQNASVQSPDFHLYSGLPVDLYNSMLKMAYALIHKGAGRPHHPLVQQAVEAINARYNQKLSLQSIAGELHINHVYLSRLFKQETGLAFKDYRAKVRVEAAKQFLLDETKSISEVSDLCGYNHPGYFSESFKNVTGLTPTEYRRREEGE